MRIASPSASCRTRFAVVSGPGRDDLDRAQVDLAARDDDRPVALAERRAVRQQDVALLDSGIGAGGERGHLEPPFERPLVQGLDVRDDRLELEAAEVDRARLERPDHERVVGIRRVADSNSPRRATLPWTRC